MVNFFDYLYSSVPPIKKGIRFLHKIRLYSLLRFIIRNAANIVIPIYYNFTSENKLYRLYNKNGKTKSSAKYIVSFTTFPSRINKVWMVIETMLRQKNKPDKIILWLSNEQFNGIDSLPKKISEQTERGLEIRFVDGNIRSHKKYYYAMQEYPNDIIITIDDDILYRNDFMQLIIAHHKKHPKDIISLYSRKVMRVENNLSSYNTWPKVEVMQKSISELFFGSGGGTLFPPNSLYKDLYRKDLFTKLTPFADDIWLNTMSRLNKTKINSISNKYHIPLPILNNNDKKLVEQNIFENLNDKQIENVRIYYMNLKNIDPFENSSCL